jgi:GTP-binding protein EngB required for normal cell division
MDLREYERSKFAIAEILRSASAFLPQEKDELRARLANLFARLAEDRFNLVVIGRFSRGKTSFDECYPRNGPAANWDRSADVCYYDGWLRQQRTSYVEIRKQSSRSEVSIETLPRYVTQQGNPGNVQQIEAAEIQLPAEILRRGFYFVDTPGVGSVIAENTLTTEAFLPDADAFILVTSFESPLSAEELRFFKAGSLSGRRIFVVLNKHDTVSPEQRDAALGFVREQLTKFGYQTPPIFSVSSTDGLKAKLSHNQTLLDASGIPELEEQLLSFLLSEKNSQLLMRICDRAREFLHLLPDTPELERLIVRIDDLFQQFGRRHQSVSTSSPATASLFPNLHQLRSCEICARVNESLWNFVSKYQYEIIVSPQAQQRFADRGGSAHSMPGSCNR